MLVSDVVQAYLAASCPEPDQLLAEMQAHGARDRMPTVVRERAMLLSLLARARGDRRIIEIGTAIGGSTLYLAGALPADGTIVPFDIDRAPHEAARACLARGEFVDRADLKVQDARDGMAELHAFDMTFVDGVKAQYADDVDRLLPLRAPGAVLAVDNVLTSGAVADGRGNGYWSDDQVLSSRASNRPLLTDRRLTGTIAPAGDGVLVAIRDREPAGRA